MSIRPKVNIIFLGIIILMSLISMWIYYVLTLDIRTYDQILANFLAANKLPGFVQGVYQDIETYQDLPTQELRSRIENNLQIAGELVQTIQNDTLPGHADSLSTIEGMTKMIDTLSEDTIIAMQLIDRQEINVILLDNIDLLDRAVELSRETIDAYLAQELKHTVPLRKEIIKKNERLKTGLFGSMLVFSLAALSVGMLFANKWVIIPLRHIVASVRNIAAGELDTSVRHAGNDEIGELASDIERMRASIKEMTENLKERERLKRILAQIANVFLTIPDKEIFGEVLAIVLQVMKSKYGVFGFIEENGDLIIPTLTSEVWDQCQVSGKTSVFPPDAWGESLWGKSIREQKAFSSDGPFHQPEGHVHIDFCLSVPIVFGNDTIGLFSVANKEKSYTEEDRNLLESIAGYISPILNARLQRDRKEREREEAEQALSESEERLRLTLATTQIGIFDWDVENDIWLASPEYYTTLGYPSKNGIADREEWLARVHPADRARIETKLREVLSGEFEVDQAHSYEYEARIRHADGTYRWQHVKGYGVRHDPEGRVMRILGIRMDIHERKTAEEALRQLNLELDQRVLNRTAQLEAANKELEAFAYSVSHDLRAPLRHIDGYIELFLKKTGKALTEEERHYFQAISDAAIKMGLLIDDLLSFSRMGRQALSFKQVDLGLLVHDVIRESKPDTAGRDIDWRIGDLPVARGDDAMLRMVLGNLIANALKFTRPRQQARIEIESLPGKNSEIVIVVRDNGVGFEMAHADKLFGVFQRLHRADEFEGTGIGLANVRRIISRHGGRTWAESSPDRGAAFYFALPNQYKI